MQSMNLDLHRNKEKIFYRFNINQKMKEVLAIALLIACILFFVLITLLSLIGMSKVQRYREDIIFLETIIDHWIVSENNYKTILKMFDEIHANDMDSDRTRLAWKKFKNRFITFFPEKVTEELLTIIQN